jgi:DNA polymerase I
MENNKPKLVLIDGNAIIHRAYHALPPLTTKKGELVNAVYGFTSVLLKVLGDIKPEYIVASFDLAAPTFRHEEFKEYKATRVKAPDELYAQIGRVKEVVRALNIPIIEKEGFEADDIIGTIVEKSEQSGKDVENIVVTGDMDTLQLVSASTKVYAMRRGMSDTVLYDEKEVWKKYGLRPEQLIDFKGLRGDPSDNIPGVKGVGEKTAVQLLQKYEALEEVYHNLDEIKDSLKEKLERDKLQAFMSKKLATIERHSPVEFSWEDSRTQDFNRQEVLKLFQELNFFSLAKRIPTNESESNLRRMETNEKYDTTTENDGAQSLKYPAGVPPKSGTDGVKDFKYEIIEPEKLEDFFTDLSSQPEIAIAVQCSGRKWHQIEIEALAFSWKNGRVGYLKWNADTRSQGKKLLENDSVRKIGYDLKNIWEILDSAGINLSNMNFDVMLAAYVIDPGRKNDLAALVWDEMGEEWAVEKKEGQLGLELEDENVKIEKLCREADYCFKLKQILSEKIVEVSEEQRKDGNLEKVMNEIEMPLVPILGRMEKEGVLLNPTIFKGISETITKKLERLEMSIYELAGGSFNINSPKQLAEVLFEKLKIPTVDIRKLKTGYSTASTELAKIKSEHKIIQKIEDYRELFKLKTTYLDTLPELVDKNSRLHTSFNQAVTATGRLSSSDPNLQNIPIRTDLGQLLRTAFEAPAGFRLVSADYSQIDLRVVAHVSGDEKLIETFREGKDIHSATAAEINKVPLSQVTETMRRKAKALNFGIIYGMSVFGFSQSADISRDEAKKFIDEYMEKFTGVAAYIRDMKLGAKEKGYVETLVGRRRYIPEINSPNFQVAQGAERMAINMPIQGLAADIVKLAMIAVATNYEKDTNVRMILQIHDEIILEVKEEIVDEVAKKVKEIMENAYELSVPLIADVKVGQNWGEI